MIDISIGFRSLLGGEKTRRNVIEYHWHLHDSLKCERCWIEYQIDAYFFEETIQLFWGFQIITSIWSFYASPVTHSDLNSDRVQNTKMRVLNINWQWLLDRVLVVAITPILIPVLRDFSLLANLPFLPCVFFWERSNLNANTTFPRMSLSSVDSLPRFSCFFLFIKTLVYKQLFYMASNIHLKS